MRNEPELALIYQRYAPIVFRRARQILGNEVDAGEVVQDVFLSLLERPEQYGGRSSITTFLYRMTTNACLARLRDERNRERLRRERLDGNEGSDALGTDVEQQLMMARAIQSMPEVLARAAVYYLVDGLTHAEIAELLGCSRRHVGNLLARVEGWNRKEGARRVSC
jgi:RNA polymerase sigma factor (sigma-70 family)